MAKLTRTPHKARGTALWNLDEALIALFIGAMNANDHVAANEAARAHHLIWSTRRFRRKSGESVNKLIHDMRLAVEASTATSVIERAVLAVPTHLRAPAFAVVTDLLLADGTLESKERRFLKQLGAQLSLRSAVADRIVEVIGLKNHL